MSAKLLRIVESVSLDAGEIAVSTKRIHAAVLNKSKYVDGPNFTCIHPEDLELVFNQYDSRFFDGRIREVLGDTPLHFGLSQRMSSAGGKTTCRKDYTDPNQRWFEISVSTALLFQCFADDDHRPIVCCGITCRDRLDALQRVMEHELVHLVEMLLWDKSSCRQVRFHAITRRLFGHTDNRHQLITPREKAFVKYGIRPGMQVRFSFEGVEHVGVVNRVNKRATVLVEDPGGDPYSNGKRYARFYVPVQMLEAVDQ